MWQAPLNLMLTETQTKTQKIHKDMRTEGQSDRKRQKTKHMIDINIEQNGDGALCGKPHKT